MLDEAVSYILSRDWCTSVAEKYFGIGVGGIVAVFLFPIRPKQKDIDEWLWVVVGDLPPAYIVREHNRTPVQALEAYVMEMRKWVSAVKSGARVDNLIPVNSRPEMKHALQLESRLSFVERKLIPLFQRNNSRASKKTS